MNVTVRLFAAARDIAGAESVEVVCDTPSPTIGDLRNALQETYPTLAKIVAHSMFAIGDDYQPDTTTLESNVPVVCIPPVSGG